MSKIRNWLLAGAMLAGLGAPAVMAGTASASPAPGYTPPTEPAYQLYDHHRPAPAPKTCGIRVTDKLTLTFEGSTFTYPTAPTLRPLGGGVFQIGGVLCDPYLPVPTLLPIHGVLFRNGGNEVVVASVVYPAIDPQGTRTFSGLVNIGGSVGPLGTLFDRWSETGTENGTGNWAWQRV